MFNTATERNPQLRGRLDWLTPAMRRHVRSLAPVLVLLLLCLAIGMANSRFLSLDNFIRIANSSSVPLILAIGATPIIIMGSIDLSVEGLLALSIVTLGMLVTNSLTPYELGWLGVALSLAVGTMAGFVNGVVHVKMRVPSFMATLGLGFIAIGVATVLLSGLTIRVLDPQIRAIALTRFLGVPYTVWVAAGCLAIGYFIQNHTRLGRNVYAIGGGEDLAKLSGVGVERVRITVFALAGMFYAVAGVVAAAQIGQAHALTGDGRLFTTVAAIVIGGTALTGGVGGVLHTVIGVLIIGVLANGMILLGVSPYIQQGVQGILIIIAVALSIDRVQGKLNK
jgi:ribose transport system permease protein